MERSPEFVMRDLMGGYRTTQMVYVAARLGVADRLAGGPMTAEQLAEAVDAHAPSLLRLLRALASLGVFAQDAEGRFGLTPSAALLRSDVEGSLRSFALTYGEPWSWLSWGNLFDCVRTGETAFDRQHGKGFFEYMAEHPEAAEVFNANLSAMTSAQAEAIVAAYDFSRTRLLVDVGGGHGALVSAVLRAQPAARAVLLDAASVIEDAGSQLERAGVAERCGLLAGDFFESVPAGGDTYVLKDIVHDWDDERAASALAKIAMTAGSDIYLVASVMSSISSKNVDSVLGQLLRAERSPPEQLVAQLLAVAVSFDRSDVAARSLELVTRSRDGEFAAWHDFGSE